MVNCVASVIANRVSSRAASSLGAEVNFLRPASFRISSNRLSAPPSSAPSTKPAAIIKPALGGKLRAAGGVAVVTM